MSELVQVEAAARSNYDAHNPPERELMADCVHCGFCLPACPTYVLWGQEMDSPRGRIYLMEKAATGQLPLDGTFQLHMDNCLGCMACMTACPSGVQYSKLIEDTRGQVERNIPRGPIERLFRKLLFTTFPYPKRLRVMAMLLLGYQRSGLQRLVRASGILRLLPRRLQAMEALLPQISSRLFANLPASAAVERPRRRVGMITGCVQQAFFQHVNEATLRVLVAEGCEVVVPAEQSCCGALMVHSGLDAEASNFARRMIATFEQANVDSIVINAAGCGSTMKEYGHLLRNDKEWAERARAFSAKCRDISEILVELPAKAERHVVDLRVAYHDACHLRHAQNIFDEPRSLLAAVPGLEVVEIGEANLCCGSAGVYNLLNPEPAEELADRKVEHLVATKARAVVSANPGCLLQLTSGLRRNGLHTMPTFHMVELLDASIRNVSVEQILRERGV
jgi:glycolate oxidase iron-sulfur subunit